MRHRTAIVVAMCAVLAASCGDQAGDETTTTTPVAETTAPPETTMPEVTTTESAPEETPPVEIGVSVATTELGEVLVDPDGLTLYILTSDPDGESACNDACAATWPPVAADVAIGGSVDATMFGTATRADGSEQLMVNGRPLYTFAGDSAPGDVNGQGVNGVWFVVDSQGNPVGAG